MIIGRLVCTQCSLVFLCRLKTFNLAMSIRFLNHVYPCEDNNADSPPKERPPTSTAAPTAETMGLSLVALTRDKPTFPLSVLLDASRMIRRSKRRSSSCKSNFWRSLVKLATLPPGLPPPAARMVFAITLSMKV